MQRTTHRNTTVVPTISKGTKRTVEKLAFQSLPEFLSYASGVEGSIVESSHKAGYTSSMYEDWYDSNGEDKLGWYGTKDWEQAVSLSKTGWTYGAERVRRIANKIGRVVAGYHEAYIPRHDVTGYVLDRDAYMMGDPYCMIDETVEYVEGDGAYVHIGINLSASSGVSADVLMMRGAAIAALAEALEGSGRSVAITAYMAIEPAKVSQAPFFEIEIPVKQYGELLDSQQVAFALAQPVMLRRFMFRVMEAEGASYMRGAGTNYGYPVEPAVSTPKETCDIYMGKAFMQAEFRNEANAIKWVRETLKAQGVEIENYASA